MENPSFEGFRRANEQLTLEKLGKLSPTALSAHAFLVGESLMFAERPEPKLFRVESSDIHRAPRCRSFTAYGYVFSVSDGRASACRKGECISIELRDRSGSFSYAASRGSVFLGTNWGDALLFREGNWCRMIELEHTYSCSSFDPGPDVRTGRQWYSSVPYGHDALVGEYPNGWVWSFDGVTLTKSIELTPPPYRGNFVTPGFESQTLAFYCGSLYVGMWPYGELWRFDGTSWEKYTEFFPRTAQPPKFPYEAESVRAGEVLNLMGQRIQSLVVHQSSLWVTTSNKGPSRTSNVVDVEPAVLDQYGAIWRVTDPYCQ